MPEDKRILTGTELPNIELDATQRAMTDMLMFEKGAVPSITPEPISDPKIYEKETKVRK